MQRGSSLMTDYGHLGAVQLLAVQSPLATPEVSFPNDIGATGHLRSDKKVRTSSTRFQSGPSRLLLHAHHRIRAVPDPA